MNDPIDSRKLQIFLCLANRGSLKAAAPELCLTSSAVSHAITSLEDSLGVQLFHRSGKGLVLTEKGEYLYRKAMPVVAQMDNIRSALSGENPSERKTLRIASGFNFVSYLVPDIVREFNECFPRGSVSVRASERDKCLELLRDREVDAAILVEPPEDGPDFIHTRLFDDELRMLVHSRNPLASLEIVPLRNIASQTLIVGRAQSHTVRSVQSQLRRRGIEFRDCVEVGSTAAIVEMVKLGQGVALLPEWVVQAESPSPIIVTRPLESGLLLKRAWGFVYSRWAPPSLTSRTFLRLCQRAVAGLAECLPRVIGVCGVLWSTADATGLI